MLKLVLKLNCCRAQQSRAERRKIFCVSQAAWAEFWNGKTSLCSQCWVELSCSFCLAQHWAELSCCSSGLSTTEFCWKIFFFPLAQWQWLCCSGAAWEHYIRMFKHGLQSLRGIRLNFFALNLFLIVASVKWHKNMLEIRRKSRQKRGNCLLSKFTT